MNIKNEYIKDEKEFIEKYLPINETEFGDEYIKVRTSNKSTYMIQFRNFEWIPNLRR